MALGGTRQQALTGMASFFITRSFGLVPEKWAVAEVKSIPDHMVMGATAFRGEARNYGGRVRSCRVDGDVDSEGLESSQQSAGLDSGIGPVVVGSKVVERFAPVENGPHCDQQCVAGGDGCG